MNPKNRFLNSEDLKLLSFSCLGKEFEHIYSNVLNRKAVDYGSKEGSPGGLQWCRQWEYPWAILNSEVKKGDRVLDCGCDNSPLLPFLSQFGCDAYGVDTSVIEKTSLKEYYLTLLKSGIKRFYGSKTGGRIEIKTTKSEISKKNFFDFFNALLEPFKKKNSLRRFEKDPRKLGFKIKYFNEKLEKMSFLDNFFDKVFCISVIEHLPVEVAYRGMKEMARVLKKGGLLILTIDNDGPHVTPEFVEGYLKLIEASGLVLDGQSDFPKPAEIDSPGSYNVLGIVLRKA